MKNAVIAIVALALLAQCGSRTTPNDSCNPGETLCIEVPEVVVVCRDDGDGWEARACAEGLLCVEGACQEMACVPGSAECLEGGAALCAADGSGWSEPAPCEEGAVCFAGECREVQCDPGALRCRDDASGVDRCGEAGTAWQGLLDCPDATTCLDGACLPVPCEPGQIECGPTTLYTCDGDGAWQGQPCPEGQPCVFGQCVECLGDESCAGGHACVDGRCEPAPPVILTEELPPASVGAPYELALTASGGGSPFTWTVAGGALPEGLGLSADGVISGVATAQQVAELTVQVTNIYVQSATRDFTLEVVAAGPVSITTRTLPAASHGLPYAAPLAATGGTPPYAWQLLDGALPAGLSLASSGSIAGVPEEIGTFPFTLRALDVATPPGFDARDFELVVEVSPLEIVGDTEYDLLLVKVVILPMLVPFIPYSTSLQARGGLTPYEWAEEPAPSGLDWLIPTWGLPDGLSLGGGGTVSGWVTDVSTATSITIPLGPELAGYFFYASVTDAQTPPDSARAIFCIPTIPL